MLIDAAIEYLKDKWIPACDRFKVLTGFDTQAKEKVHASGYWFNELYQSDIIQLIEIEYSTSSFGGFFASIGATFAGTGLQAQLKAAYKKGITPSDNQAEDQEEYIKIIADYLEENKKFASLADFKFEDPEQLVSQMNDDVARI
jgi:hypothetical protein